VFPTVLNYDYNAGHRDHWHCDLGFSLGWRSADSQVVFVKRALKEIWGASLTVDRSWNTAAQTDLRSAGYDFSASGGWDRFLDNLMRQESTRP